jgi:hypothetical protein
MEKRLYTFWVHFELLGLKHRKVAVYPLGMVSNVGIA